VEFAKESRPRREVHDVPDRGYPPRRRPAGIRISVDNISRDTSWQDLKDFGREAGSVSFADIDRDVPGRGILEYLSRDDAEQAVKILDGKDLRGQPVTVTFSEDRGGPDNFRRDDRSYRDDRRDDRYDRHRDDRYRDDRHRDAPRRGRSGSPPPRSRDDRARSPRRDYDDKRSTRGDDRGSEPYERRRDDRRREERYEDRPSRHSNGDTAFRA